MHHIFRDSGWEVEEIRNSDYEEKDEIGTTPEDEQKGLARRLNGCTHYKAVKKNGEYTAQIRVEERYRHTTLYFSALVIKVDGRHTHNYTLEDVCFFETREFTLGEDELKKERESRDPANSEHLDLLASVYKHVQTVKENIEKMYFT